ncbi:MAG: hypothetical protein ACOYU5_10380, partial [Stygiobacter sp.]
DYTIIINGSYIRKAFVLIYTGVIHGSSKKLFENNINPFWKYPANQDGRRFSVRHCSNYNGWL